VGYINQVITEIYAIILCAHTIIIPGHIFASSYEQTEMYCVFMTSIYSRSLQKKGANFDGTTYFSGQVEAQRP